MTSLSQAAALLLIVTAGSFPAAGSAAASVSGQLISRANAPIDRGTAIAVVTDDVGERADALAADIARSLETRGFHVSARGESRLELRIKANAERAQRPRSPLMLEGQGGSDDEGAGEVELDVDIDRQHELPRHPPSRLEIELILYKPGHAPVWSATVVAPPGDEDEDRQLTRMTQLAMDVFGKTEDRQFQVPD